MLFEYAVLFVVLAGTSISLVYCGITGISPIPSSRLSRRFMMGLVPADLEGGICEMGAGWGTLAFPARLDAATELVERSFAETTLAELLAETGRSTPLCQPQNESKNDMNSAPD